MKRAKRKYLSLYQKKTLAKWLICPWVKVSGTLIEACFSPTYIDFSDPEERKRFLNIVDTNQTIL